MIRSYYLLTKPGIILGNALTATAGFALASKGHLNFVHFIETLLGLAGVIASACIFNNCIDRQTDARMARTKNRPLPRGIISIKSALFFASVLLILGTWVLMQYTNMLATLLALTGFFFYVIFYSFSKYYTSIATLVGSIAGAIPPIVGYCAVSNAFDLGALLLFAILVVWQMPHFFSIALYRIEEYAAVSLPVLPVQKGSRTTKLHMVPYILGFILTTLLLSLTGYTGPYYLATAAFLGFTWLALCVAGFNSSNDQKWARQMFQYSLAVITLLSVVIFLDTLN